MKKRLSQIATKNDEKVTLLNGDCVQELKKLADESVHAIVTDPPYELGFMGKAWDATGIAYNSAMWAECLRVLKPGGHLLSFSGSRTYHRMAVAIEDAGFEIRDQIMWVYGSGFPKSLDVSKAIDKAAGAEREVVGTKKSGIANKGEGPRHTIGASKAVVVDITAPATAEAKHWEGWGTALKPAHEPIVLARKPLDGTVANNVLQHGIGALNIDGCRVGTETVVTTNGKGFAGSFAGGANNNGGTQHVGRWPANFIHDGSDEVLELFPDTGKSTGGRIGKKSMGNVINVPAGQFETGDPGYGDSGSAVRFFYCAKANKRDRNEGLDNANHHPTVKPTMLMRYLCRLITPPDGVVLDPFMGSGSTGKAAVLEGFKFIGIEKETDFFEIATARITYVSS